MSDVTKPLGDHIEHIVVLMFENRSFDNVFGTLYPDKPQSEFDGLTGSECNPESNLPDAKPVCTWSDDGAPGAGTIPYPDPGESFSDMTEQILNPEGAGPMTGFVANYVCQEPGVPGGQKPVARDIMHYYGDKGMPVSRCLARKYAVSDRWFASGPVQTLPNRTFLLCGSPGLYKGHPRINNSDFRGFTPDPYGSVKLKSICELLDEHHPEGRGVRGRTGGHLNWKVYYHEAPISTIVKYLYDLGEYGPNVTSFDYSDYGKGHWFFNTVSPTFAEDVEADQLAKFSVIEPRYISNYLAVHFDNPPNDNHPGGSRMRYTDPGGAYAAPAADVADGESLLWDVVSTLQSHPRVFEKTLLIVTYDEHGGLYDHVAPPAAPSPYDDPPKDHFAYTRYGVRVPTFFVNPRIRPHTILRPEKHESHPFDHTSIIRTVREQFPPKDGQPLPSLTPRDAQAPAIRNLLKLPDADNLCGQDECEVPLVRPGRKVGWLGAIGRVTLLMGFRLALFAGLRSYEFRPGARVRSRVGG